MGGLFSETAFGVPWVVIAAGALLVALAFVAIDTGAGASGLRWFVLRWFHPLCWVFLCAAALGKTKVTMLPVEWAGPLGALGGLCYVVFVIFWLTRGR